MPAGHPDTTTINERRPLTRGQREMLARLKANGPLVARPSNAERNVLSSLRLRGLVEWVDPARGPAYWCLNANGEQAA